MQPHLRCDKLQARYALLPGDPKRAELISTFLERPREVAKHREFWTFEGEHKGIRIAVTSTGIGCPSTSIAVQELSNLGAKTFIRVGTCGFINPRVKVGDLVVVDSAIRKDGTSLFHAPLEYPAVADFEVVQALVEAAEELGHPYHRGMVLSADSFYEIKPWVKRFKEALAFEMECSALFVQCSTKRLRAGAILAVDGEAGDVGGVLRYVRGEAVVSQAIKKEIEVALRAIEGLERSPRHTG